MLRSLIGHKISRLRGAAQAQAQPFSRPDAVQRGSRSQARPLTMPRIPIFKLGRSAEEIPPPNLSSYTPKLPLDDLQLGVDNLRHDVHLSPRFVEQARLRIARIIVRHGDMEGLLAAETERATSNHFI